MGTGRSSTTKSASNPKIETAALSAIPFTLHLLPGCHGFATGMH